jgi:hypothetical protein
MSVLIYDDRVYIKGKINKAKNLPNDFEFVSYDIMKDDEYYQSLTGPEQREAGRKFYWATIGTCIFPIGYGHSKAIKYKIIKDNINELFDEDNRLFIKSKIDKAKNLPNGSEFVSYDIMKDDEYYQSLTNRQKGDVGRNFYWATIDTCIIVIGEKCINDNTNIALYKIVK